MAFLVGGANTLSAGYNINNSVRFDGAAANGLARFGNNSRDNKTFTISYWIKRTELGAVQQLVNCKAEDSGSNAFITTINASDQLALGGQFTSAGNQTNMLITNNKLRDPSAWYHIVYRSDTTQSGATDRFKIYINGTEASYGTDNRANVSQDDTWQYFYNASSFPYAICNDERDNVYGDFYMAEHHYCDGVSNAPSAFGEADEDSGIWKPKKYAGSHGTYGHYLEFKEVGAGSGTSTVGDHSYTTGSASTIGADTSGNDHHFHVQGYATTDHCTDSPTNNFATLNPLQSGNIPSYLVTLSEGNTQAVRADNNWVPHGSTMAVNAGKWYWENKWISGSGDVIFGVQAQEWADLTGLYTTDNRYPGYYSGRVGVGYHTGSNYYHDGGTTDSNVEFESGDIIMFAMDMDNGFLYVGKNGTWNDSGDPTSGGSGTGNAYSGFAAKTMMPTNVSYNTTLGVNFGNPSFAISSGNADADGYGNFEYAVPSGYYALCTKNLGAYGG